MRVLVLSDTAFLPATAGNRRRIDAMIGFLTGAGVEVGMLMLPAADRHEWDEGGMRGRLARFEVAERPIATKVLGRLRAAMRSPAPSAAAIDVDAWCPPWFRARARAVADEWAADAVIAEYVYLSACLEPLGERVLRVIDTHDVMHRRASVYAGVGLAPQWFHTTPDEERRGLARADVVLAMHDEEAAVLRSLVPGTEVLTVGHGAAAEPLPPAAACPGRLLFVGSYNDLNVRGLRWFLDEAWPALRAAVPDAELHVCGSIAEKVPSAPAGVTMRGVVPSLRDEYAEARVVIDPVAWGTGQPIKVVEALAHGRPVVSRRAAPRGFEEAAVVGAEPGPFVDAVRALLTDDGRWSALARAAVRASAAESAPDVVFAPLLRRLRSGRRSR